MNRFAHPHILWLLLLLLPMTVLYLRRLRNGWARLRISTLGGVERPPRTWRTWLRPLPYGLRAAAVACCILALARPQDSSNTSRRTTQGIDIVLALDISGSMLAQDFKPDRITAAKEVAGHFIADRPGDRIGLVVFAGESYTQSPLTTDRSTLLTLLQKVRSGVVDDGTALGNGLATAINRLRESEAKSRVVILLTDGVNNAGAVAPLTAASIAAGYGIRVYTIGVGSKGMAPTPVQDMWGNVFYQPRKVEIDEEVLRGIASATGGRYFRATDKGALEAVYDEINLLEKSKVEISEYTSYGERYAGFVAAALVLLLLEFLFRRFWLQRIP